MKYNSFCYNDASSFLPAQVQLLTKCWLMFHFLLILAYRVVVEEYLTSIPEVVTKCLANSSGTRKVKSFCIAFFCFFSQDNSLAVSSLYQLQNFFFFLTIFFPFPLRYFLSTQYEGLVLYLKFCNHCNSS